jgi:hypothetical protein
MNVAALLLLSAAIGAEPWAHRDLNVTEGLVVWLDAGRLNEARKTHDLPPLKSGDKVPAWYDASGHGHTLQQTDEKAQPVYYGGAVRFNGENTFLDARQLGAPSEELTIVAVAAAFSNTGGFRALLATNKRDQNDYTSGVNIDQGPWRSNKFNVLSVEGSGFGGVNNLLTQPGEFGAVRRIALTTSPGKGGTRLYVDGRLNGQRDRADSTLGLDRLTIGARCFNNEGGRPNPRGMFDGDLLEVLIYNRALSESELKRLDAYLIARHGENKLIAVPTKPGLGKPLVTVEDPPPLQMLAPGFAVKQLPVDLPNINNVKYRADGKLVALAYNGDVYLLSRSEASDGAVEDKVETFWKNSGQITSPIGMALTPPGYARGTGLFVACKGKLSLIVDTDGDDRADKEMAVSTTGWTPLPHGVDALGCAIDASGNVYFGLG